MSSLDGQDQLLDEQIAYRARADEYFDGVIAELGAELELDAAVESFEQLAMCSSSPAVQARGRRSCWIMRPR
jgi:hypothetical protein